MNREENAAFCAFARWALSLVQAKRSLTFFFCSIAFFDPLIFSVLQGGVENMKDNKVFYAFAYWILFAFLFLQFSSLSLFPAFSFLALSFSFRFLYRSSRSRSPLALTFFRGRRQLPQAGEVRRPRRARRRGGCGWLVSLSLDP